MENQEDYEWLKLNWSSYVPFPMDVRLCTLESNTSVCPTLQQAVNIAKECIELISAPGSVYNEMYLGEYGEDSADTAKSYLKDCEDFVKRFEIKV